VAEPTAYTFPVAKNTALIAGVGGMCGSNMAVMRHALCWQVIGISRSDPRLGPWLRHLEVELAIGLREEGYAVWQA